MVWDAVGPGTGIQTKLGERAGRLVIPAIGRNIYSDDHGEHWVYQTMPTISYSNLDDDDDDDDSVDP